MAQLRERAAASEARLAALQRERDAERAELEAARRALAEALEDLGGEDGRAQVRLSKAPMKADVHCHLCLAVQISLHVCFHAITQGLHS